MNLRQKAKKLKRQNELMMQVINGDIDLKETYRFFTKPANVTINRMDIQQYKSRRFISFYNDEYDEDAIDYYKDQIANELLSAAKEKIIFRLDEDVLGYKSLLSGTLFVGVPKTDMVY